MTDDEAELTRLLGVRDATIATLRYELATAMRANNSMALHGAIHGYVLAHNAGTAVQTIDYESFRACAKDVREYAVDWGEHGDAIIPAQLTWRAPVEWCGEEKARKTQAELW